MSLLNKIAAAIGVTTADVVRVVTHGGTTRADWDIAHAIEQVTGRRAAAMMAQASPEAAEDRRWRAEHDRLYRALWHETQDEDIEFLREHAAAAGVTDIEPLLPAVVDSNPEPVAPTNPRAVYDPEVTVYGENTSPEDTNRVAPHHPGDHDETVEDDQEQDGLAVERANAQHLAESVFADLTEVLNDPAAAHRLTRAWTSPAEGRQILTQVLQIHAGLHLRAEIAVRAIEADLAA